MAKTTEEKYQAVLAAKETSPDKSITELCKTEGLGLSTYSYYHAKAKKKTKGKRKAKRLPRVVTIEAEPDMTTFHAAERVVAIIGTPKAIAEALKCI